MLRLLVRSGTARMPAGVVFLIALSVVRPCAAQVAAAPPEAIGTTLPIDDVDPESKVPSPEEAMRDPLQMGYLMMALSDRGEAALQQGKPAAAAKYFRAMGKAVPDRAVAFRKACRAHDAAGERAKAIETCRAALGKGGVTVQDHILFVQVMLKKKGTLDATDVGDVDAVIERLRGELALGAQQDGRRMIADLQCQVGTRLEDAARLSECTQELTKLKVDRAKISAYSWALALSKGDIDEAKAVIDEAKRAGLPAAAIESMQKGLTRAGLSEKTGASALARRWWPVASAVALGLLAAFVVRARRRSRLHPA
jgi:hypothetical protein